VILTAENHFHGNYLLRCLAMDEETRRDHILIAEQNSIIPGESTWASLRRYLNKAGLRYTVAQALKQYLFTYCRTLKSLSGDTGSLSYPYYRCCPGHWQRRPLNNLEARETQRVLADFRPDLLLSLMSRELIPSPVLDLPRLGGINMHPALLPDYRGVSPTFWCMAEGKDSGGVTLHWLDEDFDTGAIISQTLVPVAPSTTENAFYLRCTQEGARLLLASLSLLRAGKRPEEKPNPSDAGGYRSLPKREAVRAFYRRSYSFFDPSEILRGRFSQSAVGRASPYSG